MTHTQAHAPGPLDLVALVSFDGEIYENQALTRDRLGRPQATPHALGAAIRGWLGRGPHVWIDVNGRQILGIATARELGRHDVWEIDTLIDATAGSERVVEELLRQAVEAAAEDRVRQVLLRVHADGPACVAALRSAFTAALVERLWTGDAAAFREAAQRADAAGVLAGVHVRAAAERDGLALFQLFNRALPVNARAALALTLEEWEAVQERRWLGRGARELVAEVGGEVRALVRAAPRGQLLLLAEPGADAAAQALLAAVAPLFARVKRVTALLPDCASTPGALLEAHGLTPDAEFLLLVQRTARPIPVRAARQRRVVPTRG